GGAGEADLSKLQKGAWGVIPLGEVPAARLKAGNPQALEKIEALVKDKGVGLLVTGGVESLGGDWRGTRLAGALPVELSGGQSEQPVEFAPTDRGLTEYALRLAPNPKDNQLAWEKLNEPKLRPEGYTRLGTPKPGSTVLAR